MERFSQCLGIVASEERGRSVQLCHNCPHLHRALHKPTCGGHDFLKPFEVHELEDGGLSFDTEKEAGYPFKLCEAYASATVAYFPVGQSGF